MDKLLPILSTSLREILKSIAEKTFDPIVNAIINVDDVVENYNNNRYGFTDSFGVLIRNYVDTLITDEVRMLTIRPGDFEVSFLPKGKEPEYSGNGIWARTNRQSGKPGRIFQKLLKEQFKTREWEIFTNLFKAELCNCNNFELVSGEEIRYWYCCNNYFKNEGTLGNSCMRYESAQSYFDIYVDKAQMLITKKNGLLTGRALVWELENGITILDRIYTCFDYLENCFIDYAKEHGWWIRCDNSLLHTGEDQAWYSPEDNYSEIHYNTFHLKLDKYYDEYPYMDSFRYYNDGKTLSTSNEGGEFTISLDSTDGSYTQECTYVCEHCGATYYGYEGDDLPDDICWSDNDECYYCTQCCWYSQTQGDYFCNDTDRVVIYTYWGSDKVTKDYFDRYYVENPTGQEGWRNIVTINDSYYLLDHFNVDFDEETHTYKLI